MGAVTAPGELRTHLGVMLLAVAGLVCLAGCDMPFGLGLPSTRALETGARSSLASAAFEVRGTYMEAGARWTADVQLSRPDAEHIAVSGAGLSLEAILVAGQAYFRGREFLASHMGTDPLSQNLVNAAGNAWWKGSPGLVPAMPDLTQADAFQRTFLGPAVSRRVDHVSVDGVDAVDLAGPRADVYIALAAPYHLLGVRFAGATSVDGLQQADLHYGGYGQDFKITPPADVIDFSNLSTLPPIYQVVSVDTSRCASPCVVSALLKNLGGARGATAPSTITFTMTATSSRAVLGTCSVRVVPDVGYNDTTTVSCTIANASPLVNAAIVTATVDNPGRG